GRGSRGSPIVAHEQGEAVELFGYSLALESDIPIGGATLGGHGKVGEFRGASLDGKSPLPFMDPNGKPMFGITHKDVEIPLKALANDDVGDGRDFIDAFQDAGYAVIVPGFEKITYICEKTGKVMATVQAAPEIIRYSGVKGNTLTGVTRGQTTRLNKK